MSEWWQQPYPTGPLVPVPGFPRPVYPPDAKGYTPSSHGPDITAYKRAISRGGRWPWQTFDAAFSNGFSHGKAGGNVGDSGAAGFQRQTKLDSTGYIGTATFNALRAALVPKGLPNAGQPLFDTTALNMIGEAWQRFQGQPTPPPPGGPTLRQKALKAAQGQIGVKENPAGSNQTKFTDWYGMVGPWCAMFTTWCWETQGDSPSFVSGSRYAYVPYIVSDARSVRYGLSTTSSPIPGDLVCYDWEGDGTYDHVGIFESGTASSWNAIEGNTSTSNQSNGGEVMRRSRSTAQAAVTFVRVAEP